MSFDLVARHFQWMEAVVFGDAMQSARVTFLSKLSTVRHALLLGEGDGRFLQELVRSHPSAAIDCVDSSRQMLVLAKSRLPAGTAESARIKFIRADARSADLPGSQYDLIVTNFFFDCFNRDSIERIVARIGAGSSESACWLLADFQNGGEASASIRDKLLLRVMYLFFRCASQLEAKNLIPAGPYLESIGFTCEERRYQRSGFIKSEFWRR